VLAFIDLYFAFLASSTFAILSVDFVHSRQICGV